METETAVSLYIDKSEYNAVWDEKLEICYTLLECAGCKEFIGVRVLSAHHSSANMNFVGKVSAYYNLSVYVHIAQGATCV